MNFFVRSMGVLAVAAAAASCGGGGGSATGPYGTGGTGGTGGECSTATFCLGAATFSPTSATVAKNAIVVWINGSGILHHVVFDNPPGAVAGVAGGAGGDLGNMDGSATASRTFSSAGTYAFHCTIHPGMNGTLTVQ